MGVVAVLMLVGAQGCALFLIGTAAGAGAGTVSYVGNELRVTHEVKLDRAWDVANATMKDMEYITIPSETHKDVISGVLRGRNAKDQKVVVQLLRQSDKLTEIRVRVGVFTTDANRAAAQMFYDKMKARL